MGPDLSQARKIRQNNAIFANAIKKFIMKKSVLLTIGFMFLAVIAGSCSKEDEGNNSKNNPYKSLSLTAKSSEFVQQGEGFALEYIDRINAAAEKDFIVSPLSIQFLMGMLLDGAQGETAEQIC